MSHNEQTRRSPVPQVLIACGIVAGLVGLLIAILTLGDGPGGGAPTTNYQLLALIPASFLAGMLSFLAPARCRCSRPTSPTPSRGRM